MSHDYGHTALANRSTSPVRRCDSPSARFHPDVLDQIAYPGVAQTQLLNSARALGLTFLCASNFNTTLSSIIAHTSPGINTSHSLPSAPALAGAVGRNQNELVGADGRRLGGAITFGAYTEP
ncbi:hypothetical protein PCANC_07960 [Puccinia coronata f. sp. avenae]|uniref:Uncharacterized protein n=1 Tax=Puccinia coronata f. sp. avenae TaxID=200324 RepID=A0A2N5UYH2_9BASI|nr:hypothetical protein PCASD_17023 [Puccinia coronata f. sp. avenae]PLW42801.1 hypothetical protein PCANC_07960 [Puccinia coronata f. sp. avenae]